MIEQSAEHEDQPGFSTLSPDAIALEQEDYDEAIRLSNLVSGDKQQWQVYLNTLAIAGVEHWLNQQCEGLSLKREKFSSQYLSLLGTARYLQAGAFKLCLTAIGTPEPPLIEIPRAALELPNFAAHFHVVVRVLEEEGYSEVWGMLRHDEMTRLQQATSTQTIADRQIRIPIEWFTQNPSQLLLYLQCLAPQAITLPMKAPQGLPDLAQMREQLTPLLPQLRSSTFEFCKVLTWEQIAGLLTYPSLLKWLQQVQVQEPEGNPAAIRLEEIWQSVTQPAINLGMWVRGELDELAKDLSWILLPPFAPMQSPTEEMGHLRTQLQRVGEKIPPHARASYKNLSNHLAFAGVPLGLYAVTWSQVSSVDRSEWTVLFALSTAGEPLPATIQLRVSDQDTLLIEKTPKFGSNDAYLYVRVVGTWDEKFIVSVVLNEVSVTLPPFAFHPDAL